LFINIRSAASWCQPLQLIAEPRGALTLFAWFIGAFFSKIEIQR
jgi:hypothetical protein